MIPALNEAATIARVVAGVRDIGTPIVVDDGSSDATAVLAAEAGADVVRHQGNRGYDASLQTGFVRAVELGADVIATFDADGQLTAQSLRDVLAPVLRGEADIALGIRPRAARVGEMLFSLYTRVRFGVPDILCGLKAYTVGLFAAHGRFDGVGSIGTELALASLRRGARKALVPVPVLPRHGKSHFGSAWRANRRILRAAAIAIGADVRDQW